MMNYGSRCSSIAVIMVIGVVIMNDHRIVATSMINMMIVVMVVMTVVHMH